MKGILLSILFVVILTGYSCKKKAGEDSTSSIVSFTTNQKSILQSSNQFGIRLFNDLAGSNAASKNIFISPLSIYLALTMTYNGAASQTEAEMLTTLGYSGLDKEAINESCQKLSAILLDMDPKVTIEIANSIWYHNLVSVKSDFIALNKTYFNAQVTSCDFSDPATLLLINNWVKSSTHNKIEKILNQISSDAAMYLINAIYFKGIWKYQFDKSKTELHPFHIHETDSVHAYFMQQRASLYYLKNELLSAISLPYGNSGFSMVVLLPEEGKSVGDIIESMDVTTWNNWCNGMNSIDITVQLPKFKIIYDSVINKSLKTLGMVKAFSNSEADFSNIDGNKDLYISKVLHKSYVEVNEEGTEAAAVTSSEIAFTSLGDGVKYFIVDKPFIFLIKENTTQTILFAGVVNNPLNE